MIRDMSEGKPSKVLISFAMPAFLSVVFQQLYNIADSAIAGKLVNGNALAAVGASTPIIAVFMAFAVGINNGCAIVVAQVFGSKNYKILKTAISTTYIIAIVLSAVMTVLGVIFCRPVLVMLGTPEGAILEDSVLYLNIYVYGLVFLFLYNISSGLFTALGDSKTPLYFLIASSVGNIILDIIFVAVFNMGVAGVAWATFIAQGISGIVATLTLIKRIKVFKTDEKLPIFSWKSLRKVSTMSIPCILQMSFISVGNVFIQNLINSCGGATIAGFAAAFKLNQMVLSAFSAMSTSLSAFTAQCLGAKKIERVKTGFKASVAFNFSLAAIFTILFVFGGRFVMLLFVKSSEVSTIDAGAEFLSYVAPAFCIIVFKSLLDAVLKGAGSVVMASISTLSDLVFRVAITYILFPSMGRLGIWLSWPIGWFIGTAISAAMFFSGRWKRRWEAKLKNV